MIAPSIQYLLLTADYLNKSHFNPKSYYLTATLGLESGYKSIIFISVQPCVLL